ncbi:hypothetical protein ACJX0J_038660, partial [Zea mays]
AGETIEHNQLHTQVDYRAKNYMNLAHLPCALCKLRWGIPEYGGGHMELAQQVFHNHVFLIFFFLRNLNFVFTVAASEYLVEFVSIICFVL